MVQKQPAKRGRPRAYDPATALAQATAVFWDQGYAETSLDDLSRAMGMNRPSLYGAFGDKKSLYLAALAQYREAGRALIEQALGRTETLRAALQRFYAAAIDLYLTGEEGARGCLLIGTATTEAVLDPETKGPFGTYAEWCSIDQDIIADAWRELRRWPEPLAAKQSASNARTRPCASRSSWVTLR